MAANLLTRSDFEILILHDRNRSNATQNRLSWHSNLYRTIFLPLCWIYLPLLRRWAAYQLDTHVLFLLLWLISIICFSAFNKWCDLNLAKVHKRRNWREFKLPFFWERRLFFNFAFFKFQTFLIIFVWMICYPNYRLYPKNFFIEYKFHQVWF